MGKASKWMRNLLLGKKAEIKEDKNRVKPFPEETALISDSQKEKRRWSFRKSSNSSSSASRDKLMHRNRSFDAISTAQLVKQVLEDHEIEQIRVKAQLFLKTCNQFSKSRAFTKHLPQNIDAVAAAIKIQSVFRSYLARKALRALRALVKLQALVRGHQVRKQTTAVLKSMNALMTIQVRARNKRSRVHRYQDKEDGLQYKSGPLYVPRVEGAMEPQGLMITKCPSSRFLAYHELEHDNIWSPSEIFTEIISSQKHTLTFNNDFKTKPIKLPESQPPDSRSYMSNTESWKAKARSQSAPKQRPKGTSKSKNRRSTSSERLSIVDSEAADQLHKQSNYLKHKSQENEDKWLIKLYSS